jgi:hypothetical protein
VRIILLPGVRAHSLARLHSASVAIRMSSLLLWPFRPAVHSPPPSSSYSPRDGWASLGRQVGVQRRGKQGAGMQGVQSR